MNFFLDSLIKKYTDVTLSQIPFSFGFVQRYLLWLNSPLSRPPFLKVLLDVDSVLKLADQAVKDFDLPQPSITDHWVYVWGDSKFIGNVPSLSLGLALEMIQRDNFGILMNQTFAHFLPFPTP